MSEEVNSAENAQTETDLQTISLDEFKGKLDSDREFRDKYLSYLSDPSSNEEFNRIHEIYSADFEGRTPPQEEKSENPQGETPPKQTPQEDGNQEDGGTVEDEILEIKVKKSLLGTYLKNRTTEDAIVEALKGKQQADSYIESQRGRIEELTAQTMDLRKQLMDALQKEPQAQAVKEIASQGNEIEEVDYEKEIDELDPYDPESLNKMKDFLKKALKNPKQEKVPEDGEQSPEGNPLVTEHEKEMKKILFQKELDEIQNLQMQVPELSLPVPFMEMDKQVLDFYKAIGAVSGDSINFMKAVKTYYSNTPQAQQLQEMCTQRGIVPPDGIDRYQKIMTLNGLRKRDRNALREAWAKGNGKDVNEVREWEVPETPNTSLVDYYRREYPQDIRQVKMQAVIEGHKSAQRAAAESRNHVPEIPSNVGNPPQVDVSQISAAQAEQLINMPTERMTREQAQVVLKLYEANGVPCTDQRLINKAKG